MPEQLQGDRQYLGVSEGSGAQRAAMLLLMLEEYGTSGAEIHNQAKDNQAIDESY